MYQIYKKTLIFLQFSERFVILQTTKGKDEEERVDRFRDFRGVSDF